MVMMMMRPDDTVMTVATVTLFPPRLLMGAHVFASVILRWTAVGLRVDIQTHGSVKMKPLLHLMEEDMIPSDGVDRDAGGESGHLLKMILRPR